MAESSDSDKDFFEVSLPLAFRKDPLGMLQQVAVLVSLFRKKAKEVARIDVDTSERLEDDVSRMQHIACGLLRAASRALLRRELLSVRGTKVREKLVLAEAIIILSDVHLQDAMHVEFSIVWPTIDYNFNVSDKCFYGLLKHEVWADVMELPLCQPLRNSEWAKRAFRCAKRVALNTLIYIEFWWRFFLPVTLAAMYVSQASALIH